MLAAILSRIVHQSQQFVSEPPWDFLKAVRSVRCLRTTSPGLREELEQEFTTEQLQAAGVLVPGAAGEWQLAPTLAGPRFLVVRKTKDGPPCDIVGQRGSLTSPDPPAFGCHEDFVTRAACGTPPTVFVPFSGLDLALLRMLGLPVTPAAGLNALTGAQVRRFFSIPERQQTLPVIAPPRVAGHDFRFLIVGCQLAEFTIEEPPGFRETISRLQAVEDTFRISTSERFRVWQPSEEDFDRIRKAVAFTDRQLVCRAIGRSVARAALSVRDFVDRSEAQQYRDLSTARRELTAALRKARADGFATAALSQKLVALKHAFYKTIVEPIERNAAAATKPKEQMLHLVAADLMRLWHESRELVREAERGLLDCFQGNGSQRAELKQSLELVDGLTKICRELTRKQ